MPQVFFPPKTKSKGMKTKSSEPSYDAMLIVVRSSVRYLFCAPDIPSHTFLTQAQTPPSPSRAPADISLPNELAYFNCFVAACWEGSTQYNSISLITAIRQLRLQYKSPIFFNF